MAEELTIEQQPKPYGMVTGGEYLIKGGIPRLRNKVAIVGFAPSSMTDVRPYFDDPSFEIWGLNQLTLAFPMMGQKATRWFQLHTRREYDMAVRDHSHHNWLAEQKSFPIYMQERDPEIPMSVPFPKDMMLDKFGRYFTNSISWEIALAIHEGFSDIYIFGVDMATDQEYREQRPSCEYFVGWARALGINVFIPPKSDLCKTMWLYPFEDDSVFRQKIDGRRVELRNRLNGVAQSEQAAHDERLTLLGALENMNYIEQTWCGTVKELTILKNEGPKQAEAQNVVCSEGNSCGEQYKSGKQIQDGGFNGTPVGDSVSAGGNKAVDLGLPDKPIQNNDNSPTEPDL